MPVDVEPFVFTIRCFDDGKKWGDEYRTVLTVQKMDDIGYCSGCHGAFSHTDYRELERKLKKFGIKKLKWRRAKQ